MKHLQIFLFLFLIFIVINKNKEPFADSGYYENNNYSYLNQDSESNLNKVLYEKDEEENEDLEMSKSSLYEMYDKVDEYMFSGQIEKILCYKDIYCESSFIYSSYSPSS
jgi:nucleoid-associated protein YejK